MPRATYLEPCGNPTRIEKQPRQRLDLEFAYTGGSRATTRAILAALLILVCLMDAVSIAMVTVFGGILGRMPIVCGLIMLAIWSLYGGGFGGGIRGWFWGTSRVALAAGFAGASLAYPPSMLFGLAGILSLQLLRTGEHWIARTTTSPLPASERARLREKWTSHLRVVAVIPLAAAVIAWLLEIPILFPLLLILFAAVQLFCCRTPLYALKSAYRAISSYCAYNAENIRLPGIAQSPGGTAVHRQLHISSLATAFAILATVISLTGRESAMGTIFPFFFFPASSFVVMAVLLQTPILEEGGRVARRLKDAPVWKSTVDGLRASENPVARHSYFLGNIATDGSPLLVPRQVFNEPSHFLGSTGAGKTSKGLAPWIEQTIGFGDCSLIVLDLKADTLETLATMRAASEEHAARGGRELPLKVFSSQNSLPTHGFNPLGIRFWNEFTLYQQVDILCGALGLIYGSDYGEGYYTSANAETCYETLRRFPNIRSFRELAERCYQVLAHPEKYELLKNTARNADHLYSQLRRLADFEQLQITCDRRYPQAAFENAIDLSDFFRRPQLAYLHLSATLGAGSAPTIARLFTYMLLTSATQTERQCRVYLVIDEFQRMVADNLEYILQLARSMGVGVVLANQSMADLKTSRSDMLSIVETNCRFRQWFDVPSEIDRRLLTAVAGETVEYLHSESESWGNQSQTVTSSQTETILPRFNMNEIIRLGDDPTLSVVRITRGDGYAQFGGFPVVVKSGFHIDEQEYERRKSMAWPADLPGQFVPKDVRAPDDAPKLPDSHAFIREVDGRVVNDTETPPPNVQELFDGLSNPEGTKQKRGRGKKK